MVVIDEIHFVDIVGVEVGRIILSGVTVINMDHAVITVDNARIGISDLPAVGRYREIIYGFGKNGALELNRIPDLAVFCCEYCEGALFYRNEYLVVCIFDVAFLKTEFTGLICPDELS